MKKYNFVQDPQDPFEPDNGSPGGLSPGAKRLLIIGIVGIVLAGGLYVYTRYFVETPPPPPQPLSLRQRQAQRRGTQVPARPPQEKQAPFRPPQVREEPVKPSQMTRQPVKPSAPVKVAEAEKKKRAVPTPKQEAPRAKAPVSVKGPERVGPKKAPQASPTLLQARAKPEKPTPEARAKPEKPPVKAQPKVEKPAPKALAKVTKSEESLEKRYTLQVASLVREKNALSLEKKLGELGYTPVVRKMTASITHHRVYGGEFGSREEAEQAARKLNVDGYPSKVIKTKEGKFAPEVGSFLRLNEAIDLAHNLQTKNYAAKIVSRPTSTPVHQVRVGKYENRAEALKALESLKGKGFEPIIVKR